MNALEHVKEKTKVITKKKKKKKHTKIGDGQKRFRILIKQRGFFEISRDLW